MKVSAPPDSIETAGALTPFASRISMGACRLSLANAAHAQTPAQPRTAIITLRFIPSPLPWPRNGRRCASGLRGMDGIPAGMNRPPRSLAAPGWPEEQPAAAHWEPSMEVEELILRNAGLAEHRARCLPSAP